jgi:predicted metalloprotease with PDZ domain
MTANRFGARAASWWLASCLTWLLAPAAQAADEVSYKLRPVLAGGALAALAVEARFTGDPDGETTLRLPVGDDAAAPQDFRNLRIEGAAETSEGRHRRVLRHKPSAPIIVRYEIVSGYAGLPPGQPFRPLLRPDWFFVHGERAFARPDGRPEAAVRLAWLDLPQGWTATSNLDGLLRPTVETLEDVGLFGGEGWREASRSIGQARLRVLYRPADWTTSPEGALDGMAAVVKAGFDYWGDPPRDFLVPLIRTGSDFGGRGLADGFLINAGTGADLRAFTRIFTHEHQHSWISRQIGGFPGTEDNLMAWLNEGFTEAVAARVLLRSGLWTLEEFVADLNASLLHYAISPERTAPNRRIQEARSSNFFVSKLAYDRGRLLALLWDYRLRGATSGRAGLDAVLQAQRRMARANRETGRRMSADLLLPIAVRQTAGIELGADLGRYVERGEAITLPPDLFAGCGVVEWTSQPAFDRGFDLAATLNNGRRVTGLKVGGPAARAGLREGDRIRVSELPWPDSQTVLTYRVIQADGTERAVSYKPEGAGTVTFQRFRLNAGLNAADRERCRALISGG